MGRIIAIDYGLKRTGIAVTDELQLIATGLQAVETHKLIDFLIKYLSENPVETILIGEPKRLNDEPTHITNNVHSLAEKLKNFFPATAIKLVDERFTSKIAKREIAGMGLKKSQRKEKELTDVVSAVILLQGYLDSIK
jgi:putative Holliday junction resolvase